MKCLSNREIMNLLKDDKARLEFSSNEYIICKTSDSKFLIVSHTGLDFVVDFFDQIQLILHHMYFVRLAKEHPELAQDKQLVILLLKDDTSFLKFSSIHDLHFDEIEEKVNNHPLREYYHILKFDI